MKATVLIDFKLRGGNEISSRFTFPLIVCRRSHAMAWMCQLS